MNPEKTDDLILTASLNCITNAAEAYTVMKYTFEHFTGNPYNEPRIEGKKRSVKAIHYVQSFDPKDNVSPELAHKIAKAFAKKAFGADCQVVIATHTDKEHVHSHIVVNSYTTTGRHIIDNQRTLKEIRQISDKVCAAFGVQPYDKSKGRGRTMAYNEWEHRKKGTSWKQQIRDEIDKLIPNVSSLEQLLQALEDEGYEIKRGKYISIKAPGQQRFVRTKTLGDEYTEDSLNIRIQYKGVGSGFTVSSVPSELRDKYNFIIGEIVILAKHEKKAKRRYNQQLPYSADNDLDIYKLNAQLQIINHDNIGSIGELEGRISRYKSETEELRQELNKLLSKTEQMESMIEQGNLYFELTAKNDRTALEELRMNLAGQTMRNLHIESLADFERLKSIKAENDKKIADLTQKYENCKSHYDVYLDIANTYHDISEGDYIDRLVEEEKQRREQEAKKSKKKL